MPAQRTKGTRRSNADGQQLVWTDPVEPAPVSGIAFAANLTPVTFNETAPSTPTSPASESLLFPSADPAVVSRRPGHTKKKPANHIPRPPNAFILFRSAFIKSQHVSTEVETNHSTLSKIIGLTWQNLPEDERQVWHSKAKAALDEHKRKFPQYAFRPLHSKDKGSEKRKVREVGPKDLKRCAKIAELLVEGLKGQELEEAIQEFDKHHVPEIVTRFEAPVTARMFRRSSSSSGTDDEDEEPRPTKKSKRRARQPSPQTSLPPSPNESECLDDYPPLVLPPDDFKQEPSFDFNTFSFDHITTSIPQFACDTMADDVNIQLNGLFDNSRPMLSVNTSFTSMDNWTRPSSPQSSIPTTPYYPESPACDSFASFTSACPSMSGSFDDLSTSFYNSNCHSPSTFSTPCNSVLSNLDFGALSFSLEQQAQVPTCASSFVNHYLDLSVLSPQYQV